LIDLHQWRRASGPLLVGFRCKGPAIIEEFGAATVMLPSQHLTVDSPGILIVKAA
jgi:hypothetical protein